jgi:hypothetical protein
MATVTVNGKEVEIGASERLNCIQAASKVGVEIPAYCWHPALSVVASCRMCLVAGRLRWLPRAHEAGRGHNRRSILGSSGCSSAGDLTTAARASHAARNSSAVSSRCTWTVNVTVSQYDAVPGSMAILPSE